MVRGSDILVRGGSMRYLLIIGGNDKSAPAPSPADSQKTVQAFMRFSEEVHKAGKAVVSERLRPEDQASRVRVKGGHHQITDGPVTETKEALGGSRPRGDARSTACAGRASPTAVPTPSRMRPHSARATRGPTWPIPIRSPTIACG